jgi:hypothetical protein
MVSPLSRSYSYSAVGLNFLASSFVILTAIICVGAAQQEIWSGMGKKRILLDLPLLIDSNFCAGAAMIRQAFPLRSRTKRIYPRYKSWEIG